MTATQFWLFFFIDFLTFLSENTLSELTYSILTFPGQQTNQDTTQHFLLHWVLVCRTKKYNGPLLTISARL